MPTPLTGWTICFQAGVSQSLFSLPLPDTFDVQPLDFAKYYYAFIVANFSSIDKRGTVKFVLKGPVKRTNTFPNQVVDGNSVIVFFFQDSALNRVGNYSLKASMAGVGASKSRFCAGC